MHSAGMGTLQNSPENPQVFKISSVSQYLGDTYQIQWYVIKTELLLTNLAHLGFQSVTRYRLKIGLKLHPMA